MKGILKGAAIFALGLAIGCGVAGYALKRFYQHNSARLSSFSVGGDVLLAENLRAGRTEYLLESTDRRIADGIFELHTNEAFKDLVGTEASLTAAKRYYVCTKIEYPAHIAPIMNDLPPVQESECPLPE